MFVCALVCVVLRPIFYFDTSRHRQEGSENLRKVPAVGRRAQKVCERFPPSAGGLRKFAKGSRRRQEGSENLRKVPAVGRRAQKVCGRFPPSAGGFRKFAEGSRRRQEGLENLRKVTASCRVPPQKFFRAYTNRLPPKVRVCWQLILRHSVRGCPDG